MIASLRPYPEYKDSGAPWAGEIPRHWEIRRNGRLFAQWNETGKPDLPILEVSIRGGVAVRDLDAGTRKQTLGQREGYKWAAKGDIAYNTMRMWQGAVGVAPTDGLVSPAYVVVRPRADIDSRYFAYLFRTPAYMDEINSESRGIVSDRNRLYWEDFKQISATIPPLSEQRLIADYLDAHAICTRRMIRAKQRLLDLLNEQKQAIIHRAVTRGLDPNVRLKPSGIEWIGDVPGHWSVSALRMRYSIELGKMLDAKRITGNHLVPYLRNIDVQWDRVNSEDLPVMDIPEHEHTRYFVRPGDLLVCEGGDVGRSAFWDGALPACGYQKALHRVRPHAARYDYPRFLFYVLYAASKRGIFVAEGSENTIAHLTGEKLRRHRFTFPPRAEQETITHYLDVACRGITEAVDRANRHIQLLREYRVRLSADVATGKVDVRGLDLPALDEVDLLEDVNALADQGEDEVADAEEAGDADE